MYASVWEKASWVNESQHQQPLSALARVLLIMGHHLGSPIRMGRAGRGFCTSRQLLGDRKEEANSGES